MRALPLLAAVAATVTAALPAAPAAGAPPQVPPVPMVLPGEAAAAAARADRRSWLVGARPVPGAGRIARRFDAAAVTPGAWRVPVARARPLAAALRRAGLLTYAEPNRLSTLRQRAVPQDPYDRANPWRDLVVDPALAPPEVTEASPVLALVDAKADVTHREFAGSPLVSLSGQTVANDHGTATAAVAMAPTNGVGMTGVWPGARAINVPLPADSISCDHSARGILRAVRAGAAVVNMSYGSEQFCQTEYEALQRATKRGVTLVAAAGNEFSLGNPLEFPASLPHVLTVGAIGADDRPTYFSNQNAALDLVALGEGIVTAVPVSLDRDGRRDGYTEVAGTSFSAPIVAAASAWVRQVRPDLTVDQVAQVIRLSARQLTRRRYEPSTGFGALDVAAALTREPPIADVQEPNEDIGFVDGRAFKRPNPYISTGRPASLEALLDAYEDPDDVYRVRVPRRSTLRIALAPDFGDPDLEVYARRARRVGQRRYRIARSARDGQARERVAVRNRSRRGRVVFVRAFVPADAAVLDSRYELTVR